MTFEPYEISFATEAIDDLHRRIDGSRWPVLPFDTGWTTGTDDATLRDLVTYWRTEYDWFARQGMLNELNHLRGPVEGEQLHCVRYEAEESAAFPLLVLHGWPGSFVEFLDAAELLRAGVDGAAGFDVVVPSLPGFALSEAPRDPGMHGGRIAERLHRLMSELGYQRYGVQGGDWGAVIGTALALRHPESVVGLHLNLIPGSAVPPPEDEPSEAERAYREFRERFNEEELGYYDLQASKPQTLAYALHGSPVGLLAWILEKFWAWADHGDDLWETFDRDRVLTNVMMYWLPGAILSSSRIYYEMNHPDEPFITGRVEVRTGYARFPKEPWAPPPESVERGYNLVHYSEQPRGGHFAAMEQPGLWAADVAAFFGGL